MKTLRSISTAVLFLLMTASTATAEPSIHLTVEPAEISSGSPNVIYHVSGESEVNRKYEVRICQGPVGFESENIFSAALTTTAFNETHSSTFSGIVGNYTVCADVTDNNRVPAEASASFTVVKVTKAEEAAKAAAEAKKKQDEEAEAAAKLRAEEAAKAPSLSFAPAVAPVVKPVMKPVSKPLSKLAKALKQCKKLKNKKKRAKCERSARRAVRH